MKKEILSQFGHPDLILLGFLLFFTCFMGVLIWVTQSSRKSHFNTMSQLPLQKGE